MIYGKISLSGLLLLDIQFFIILFCHHNQETSAIDTTALTMAESAEVTVRKTSIVILCQADSNYSQPGECVIYHIDTSHHLKRFQNSANANGHAHPVQAQAFIQYNLAMDACDTDTTDATVSDKHSL